MSPTASRGRAAVAQRPLLLVGVRVCAACVVFVGAMVDVAAGMVGEAATAVFVASIACTVAVAVGLRVGGIIMAAVGTGAWVGTAVGVGYNPFGAPSHASHPCSN